MVSEIKKLARPLSRETVNLADKFVEELSKCILNVGDEGIYLALKESNRVFHEVFNRAGASQEYLQFVYENMTDNLVAALRHYDYVSLTARTYVSKRLYACGLMSKYMDIARDYTGNPGAQVIITRASKTYDDLNFKLHSGLTPTDAELILFEEQVFQCEQVVVRE